MVCRSPLDLRKRVVIDGDPVRCGNICGYANYASGKSANAMFLDETVRGAHGPRVAMYALEQIEPGVEIRVDYDRGVRGVPYMRMIMESGRVPLRCLTRDPYKAKRWTFPTFAVASPVSPVIAPMNGPMIAATCLS
eukprot:2261867-Pleurochrysis_carterae.AAC.1